MSRRSPTTEALGAKAHRRSCKRLVGGFLNAVEDECCDNSNDDGGDAGSKEDLHFLCASGVTLALSGHRRSPSPRRSFEVAGRRCKPRARRAAARLP